MNCPDCGRDICPRCGKPTRDGTMGAAVSAKPSLQKKTNMTASPWVSSPEAGIHHKAPPKIGMGWFSTCDAGVGGPAEELIWMRFARTCQYQVAGSILVVDVGERLTARWPSGPFQMAEEFHAAMIQQGITAFAPSNTKTDLCLAMNHVGLVTWAARQVGMA